MKHVKILLSITLLAVLAVGSFAFTSKSYHKALTINCEYYTGTYDSPTQPGEVTDAAILTGPYSTLGNPPTFCDGGPLFCALCYDPAKVANFSTAQSIASNNHAFWPTTNGGEIVVGTTHTGVFIYYKSE